MNIKKGGPRHTFCISLKITVLNRDKHKNVAFLNPLTWSHTLYSYSLWHYLNKGDHEIFRCRSRSWNGGVKPVNVIIYIVFIQFEPLIEANIDKEKMYDLLDLRRNITLEVQLLNRDKHNNMAVLNPLTWSYTLYSYSLSH